MGVTVKIDTGGFTDLSLHLRALLASFPTEERVFLAACAEAVSEDAKERASGSKKTASTIRVIPLPPISGKPAFAVGAGVSGETIYPLLREGGNGVSRFSEWKHPVFGNEGIIVSQKTDPYLEPALRDKGTEMEEIAGLAIEQLLDEELSGTFSGE